MPSDLYDLDRKKREICSEGDATEAVTLGNPLRPGSTAGSVSLEDYSRLQMDSYFATTEYGGLSVPCSLPEGCQRPCGVPQPHRQTSIINPPIPLPPSSDEFVGPLVLLYMHVRIIIIAGHLRLPLFRPSFAMFHVFEAETRQASDVMTLPH